MSVIGELKNIIGYTGNDLDMVFAVLSCIIVMYFVFSLFSILMALFKR